MRYANRAGLLPSTLLLQGELWCTNVADRPIEALGLTVVPLDAFAEPVRRAERTRHQVVVSIPSGATSRIAWQLPVRSGEVFEVKILVTQVRFADGTSWRAPDSGGGP